MNAVEILAGLKSSPARPRHCRSASLPAAIALAFATVIPVARAQAQATAPAASASAPSAKVADATVLDAVTISATRRREPAKEVPMQVNVLPADDLQRQGARSLEDYANTVPGLNLTSGGAPGYGNISIRGVTTGVQTSATVGVYLDDVATGSNGSSAGGAGNFLDMGLLDLNHVEVLRGPQGTLYGATSMGGLVKYVTNVPDTFTFGGHVSLGGSVTAHGRPGSLLSGVINVPVKEDVAAFRVSAYQENVGGFVDAVGPQPGRDNNRGTSNGGRFSALLTPMKELQLRFTATLQNIKRDGLNQVDYNPKTSQPAVGDLQHVQSLREPSDAKNELYGLDIDYDLGFARLNSITSYQTLDHKNTLDVTSIYAPLLAGAGLIVDTVNITYPLTNRRTSQEFRLTSKADKKFEWLAGLYLDNESGQNTQLAGSTVAGAPGPELANVSIPSTYKEYTGYGDVTWKFDSGFAVTGGVRVAHNKQTYIQKSSGALVGPPQSINAASSDTSTTFLLTGAYALDKQSNVYGRIASGYRPGGPNAVLDDPKTGLPLAPPSFGPDTVTSYELGYKANLVANQLSVDAAIYDVEWKDIQQPKVVNGLNVIVNAGKARVRGAEVALDWRPDAYWSLRASATYIDGRFTTASPGLGVRDGDRLPDTARFSTALQLNRTFSLAQNPAYAGVTYRYVGARNAGVPQGTSIPSYDLPEYSLVDFQAGVSAGRFSLALWLRNAFDKRAQLSATTAFIPLGGDARVSVAQPRTLGATLTATF